MLAHSTKYDGSLHYRYPTRLVHQEPELLVVYAGSGTIINGYRHVDFAGTQHSLGLLWPDRHYNLWVKWEPDWTPACQYVNIATPASWDHGMFRFIDLDLDLIHEPDTAEPRLDDADEFERHAKTFGYPADLVARCWAAVDEVRDLFAGRVWPFDGSLYHWRPGVPFPVVKSA